MKSTLKHLVENANCYVEARYHKRISNAFGVQKGRVDVANHSLTAGVGIRVLVDGSWGFSSTPNLNEKSLQLALKDAIACAKTIARLRSSDPIFISKGDLATEHYELEGYAKLLGMSHEEKLHSVIEYEKALLASASSIQLAKCQYREIFEEKIIVTSDGAEASLKIPIPEVHFVAIAEKNGDRTSSHQSAAITGNWECLYQHPSLEKAVETTGKLAVDLLNAKHPEGGLKKCILAPSIVGLLCHEAVGHTVEADFVKAGSVAQGKIGQRVGSDLVNMADSGLSEVAGHAVGTMPFDDEGVKTQTTTIIENGILKSYLHNKETAHEFETAPTGNARAWLFDDEPIIRMRNTYFLPGTQKLASMINEIDDGYLIEGSDSGEADSNGEFMFGAGHLWRIKGGKKTELLKEATFSGIAFDVLKTVDAVSEEFRWDSGAGHCGKGQPAKVDAGGPYIRCDLNIGGR